MRLAEPRTAGVHWIWVVDGTALFSGTGPPMLPPPTIENWIAPCGEARLPLFAVTEAVTVVGWPSVTVLASVMRVVVGTGGDRRPRRVRRAVRHLSGHVEDAGRRGQPLVGVLEGVAHAARERGGADGLRRAGHGREDRGARGSGCCRTVPPSTVAVMTRAWGTPTWPLAETPVRDTLVVAEAGRCGRDGQARDDDGRRRQRQRRSRRPGRRRKLRSTIGLLWSKVSRP